MRIRDDYRSLSGSEKVAILMLSVDEKHAAKLFESIGEEEVRDISRAMASLGTVSADIVERLFEEFAQRAGPDASRKAEESAATLLKEVMGGKSRTEAAKDADGPSMWEKLTNVNEQVLANFLKNEYPQTVAVVLSRIKPDHAARVIATLPEAFAMEVISRMLDMDTVRKEVVDDVEKTLKAELMSNLQQADVTDGHELVADILNRLDRSTENRLMTMLEERNRESADRLRDMMFTFDDLGRIDAAGIQTLLRTVDKKLLTVALKGASDTIRDLLFDNMSERASTILQEDMAAMGPIRLRDVDDAQAEIVQILKGLVSSGEIVVSDSDTKDAFIY